MNYVSKRAPRAKQQEALNAISTSPNPLAFALRMEMRTGKTKVIADDFGERFYAGEIDDIIIIAPGGVYKTWWKPETNDGLCADWPDELIDRSAVHVWRSGTYGSDKRKRELAAFLAHKAGPRVLIMNVECISNVEDARDLLTSFGDEGRRIYCAIDESTIIKNPTAKRTKFVIHKLRKIASVRRILSGLITPRSPLDLWAQFYFLDWEILGHDKYRTFVARYAITQRMDLGGRRFDMVVGFKNIEELYGLIAPHSFRVRLSDCYDLPDSSYAFLDVELTAEQKKIYREVKEYATAELAAEQYVTANSVISQILRLHQILMGHTVDENGVEHTIPEQRTRTLLDYLEGYSGKAIIWASYDIDVRKIADALTKEYGDKAVARFWGGNKDTREAEELQFKTQPECRFMVATPDAGGMGRTWDVANLVIYYSSKNNLEHRSQSESRPLGVGKRDPITYVDMRAPGTVEEPIIKALREKWNMASMINGDNYREWLI